MQSLSLIPGMRRSRAIKALFLFASFIASLSFLFLVSHSFQRFQQPALSFYLRPRYNKHRNAMMDFQTHFIHKKGENIP